MLKQQHYTLKKVENVKKHNGSSLNNLTYSKLQIYHKDFEYQTYWTNMNLIYDTFKLHLYTFHCIYIT